MIAMVMLAGCTSKTCTLKVVNNYSRQILVKFAETQSPTDDEVKFYAEVPAGQMASKTDVDVANLYAIVYAGTGEQDGAGNEILKKITYVPLSSFAGMRYVTVTCTADGLVNVNGSDM